MEFSFEELEDMVKKRVERFNANGFADPVTDCTVCRGKGLIAYVLCSRGNCTMAVRDCDCKRPVTQQDKLRHCGMPELVQRCSFENFQATEPWQEQLLQLVRDCAGSESWLLLCGQTGSGKTHLAAALCRELICRGESVLCVSWPETVRRILNAGFDRQQYLQPLLNASVLFLDDLFKSGSDVSREVSRQELDVAFEIVEYRNRKEKRTLVTTELLTGELQRLNEGLFGRITERCGTFISNTGRSKSRNYRLKSA